MRVISQNGKFDLPYENLAIFIEYENVIARFENERYLLAQYSSEAKAIKAMEMLRKAWINVTIEFTHGIYHRNIIFQFPRDSEV
jgi:hypothetical protein